MTKNQLPKVSMPSVETMRREERKRLYAALANEDTGSEQYSKLLAQIASLEAHTRALELKESEQAHTRELDSNKQAETRSLELGKAQAAAEIERQKLEAARTMKMYELGGKIAVTVLVIAAERSGIGIISKAFGFIRD